MKPLSLLVVVLDVSTDDPDGPYEVEELLEVPVLIDVDLTLDVPELLLPPFQLPQDGESELLEPQLYQSEFCELELSPCEIPQE